MKSRLSVVAALACLIAFGSIAQASPPNSERPRVQIAILLDTSNSMDGLISQAKTQLWSIVNEFVKARKDGKPPVVQVSLFEYGKQSLVPGAGFVRMILPLTDDLDRLSEELFSLKTNGGDEFCGWVIRDAVNRLEWSPERGVYKAIFIAGNEPFTQGPVDFRASCRSAVERGIIVNTIHCGNDSEGRSTGWSEGATLADGRYICIDQNIKVVDIPAPQDKDLARLGVDLNKTYIPYGKLGKEGQARQEMQDVNAQSVSSAALAQRSVSKGNALYNSDGWDLVDAIKNNKCKLEDLKDEDLPEGFRKLDLPARKARVEQAGADRKKLQTQIAELNVAREKYLTEERKKHTAEGADTLDKAIISAIREQASKKQFRFE